MPGPAKVARLLIKPVTASVGDRRKELLDDVSRARHDLADVEKPSSRESAARVLQMRPRAHVL